MSLKETVDLDLPVAAPYNTTAVSPKVRVVVRMLDRYMRLAVIALLEQGGVEVLEIDDGTLPLITDDNRQRSCRTILIIDDTFGAAQEAVTAMRRRQLGGVVSRHEPDHLLLALSCVGHAMIALPTSILDLANEAPALGARQLRILALVSSGMPNNRIAERLALSEPTVKREISELFRIFHCSTRLELAMKSAEVGYSS
jgi:DNA-binding NarL/FixJ family response regulator